MAVRRILKKGDHCPAVVVLQAVLTTERFMGDGKTYLDEEFGKGTEDGVIAFQRWAISRGHIGGLAADGEVANKTFSAMLLHLGVELASLPDLFWPQE